MDTSFLGTFNEPTFKSIEDQVPHNLMVNAAAVDNTENTERRNQEQMEATYSEYGNSPSPLKLKYKTI